MHTSITIFHSNGHTEYDTLAGAQRWLNFRNYKLVSTKEAANGSGFIRSELYEAPQPTETAILSVFTPRRPGRVEGPTVHIEADDNPDFMREPGCDDEIGQLEFNFGEPTHVV